MSVQQENSEKILEDSPKTHNAIELSFLQELSELLCRYKAEVIILHNDDQSYQLYFYGQMLDIKLDEEFAEGINSLLKNNPKIT